MKCGAKRYIVKIALLGNIKIKEIVARSPAAARKIVRKQYAHQPYEIKSVLRK